MIAHFRLTFRDVSERLFKERFEFCSNSGSEIFFPDVKKHLRMLTKIELSVFIYIK
jgi:hypothetical protein